MSFPKTNTFSDSYALINSLFHVRNSCPICHLPLCYKRNSRQDNDDGRWCEINKEIKRGIESENLYGTSPEKTNMQVCHLVARSMVPDIDNPLLYFTPCTTGTVAPEPEYFIYDTKINDPQMKLFAWNYIISDLCCYKTRNRLKRASEYLNICSTHFFLGCADCNMYHTGHDQLRRIMNKLSNNSLMHTLRGGAIPDVQSLFSVYTLIFHAMKEPVENAIVVNASRCETWQIELWLNYCGIMFLCQMERQYNGTKYTSQDFPSYMFKNAHRDMGIMDFYMSQMIAVLLYANFDVHVDYLWLHQHFLSHIPRWAEERGLFKTATHSYYSLWRMVVGKYDVPNPQVPQFFPAICDPNLEFADQPHSEYRFDRNHFYYWDGENNSTKGAQLQASLYMFFKTWVIPLGVAIDASMVFHQRHPLYNAASHSEQGHIMFFHGKFMNEYQYYFADKNLNLIMTDLNGRVPNPKHAYRLFDELVLNGGMGFMEFFKSLFAQSFPPHGAQLLYENLKTLAVARANVVIPLLQLGIPDTPAIRRVRQTKPTYDQMIGAIGT